MTLINAGTLYLKQSRPFFRIGLCLILIGGITSFSQQILRLFSLTSSDLMRFEIWRLFTHFVFETNVFAIIAMIWSLHQVASLMEPNWGWFETTKYLFLAQVDFI
ncbi:unnamed protein product [Thelazia callipaeda]|uniref:DUF2214 domain-containing protein n=1 Tax=Thelazia callipaeda TaxID=103827 RepID=A0A0N5CTY0_THECL|nr:unnamed protein product [Thelazia callipaeda]